jgi:hypothetical protein
MTLYSQRDPRWAKIEFAGGMTFAQAGCYTTCYAMLTSLAGYSDTPPEVATKLRDAGCYEGADLLHPERGMEPYPALSWFGRDDWPKPLTADELAYLAAEIAKGPTILEVDFVPSTSKIDTHFVVAERISSDGLDVEIADPWDGQRKSLLRASSYGRSGWTLAQAVWGLRKLRVADN